MTTSSITTSAAFQASPTPADIGMTPAALPKPPGQFSGAGGTPMQALLVAWNRLPCR